MEILTQVTCPGGETIVGLLLIMAERNPEKEISQSEDSAVGEKERLIGELGINEGRRSLDHQVELLRQQKNHYIEIMKLNLICLSILVAAFGIGRVNVADLNTIGLALPLIFFVSSITLSISMYHSINPTIGMNSHSVYELDPRENLNENFYSVKDTYANAINQNKSKIKKSSRLMLFSYFSTLVGISSTIAVVSIGFL
ncbi:hypothetical protein [Halorubrum ezzemoulense]|uniref:hypothetical protein n=1 Tax=Halorubrum ezzemoulense TaxID=337243 RepID=UPI0015C5ED90|nr:hypothetical protein [Halorubrum ezzemoulense]